MKTFYFIFFAFIISSCHHTDKTNNNKDDSKQDSIYNFLFNKDSIIINIVEEDTIVLSKRDLVFLKQNYPEFFDNKLPVAPDTLYDQIKRPPKDTIFNNFSSEVGQDYFYILYSYFLSIRNGIDKYKMQREKLVDIFETINNIHEKLSGVGTYYGHMSSRIHGYAEYFVSMFPSIENNFTNDKEKQLFIQSLKQNVADGIKERKDLTDEEKKEMQAELYKWIENLSKEIDSFFYLKMAKEFEHSLY